MTGADVIKVRDQLAGERSPFEAHMNECAAIYTPFTRINTEMPDLMAGDKMFDSTPRQSARIYANGLCSLVIPREEQWAEFVPPKELEDDEDAKKWFREASETTFEFIEASNFYEEIQESIFESGAFGTCSLYCGDLDEFGDLCFLHQTIGTYYIAEDSKGKVNTHCRDLSYTADQAADEFGAENLPPKIRNQVGKPLGMTEKHRFIHLVTKRRGPVDKDAPENEQLPWIDIVVAAEGKKIIRQGGLHEFNFACHRHARYAKAVYGFGPGAEAKGDAYQLSFLNELADLATEKEVFPPLVASSNLEGEIAQGGLEVTYVDPGGEGGLEQVKELHTRGRYDILKDRLKDKAEAVRALFFVDLFQLFSLRAKERGPLTATEANYVASEKLTQFSPVYGRFMNELVDVVLARAFAILYRAGKFKPAPESVVKAARGGRVRYRNKIALAMQAKENGALLEFFNLLLPVLSAFPELGSTIFDSLRIGTTIRDALRNAGVPERWIADQEEFEKAQAARAEAAAQRAQIENAEMASKAAANLGKAPAGMVEQARQVA